ncbi:DUF4440 domain-containing protein [Hymenobacter sp. 15J16-1T3B]|uniref:DUF4440 domain-containing protein n=1 Tax=Hymenobacter sp. 15J16-1T3B TaxID=2886941 RepID=UPI001D116F0B|nr:DUF4440 domain-containing protein [Hymenobacter sp. 15J16-1T3B]MCC3159625.1 DUF4440 domain-containing protein [Hymenobacter sp. 15J16-1T3B]
MLHVSASRRTLVGLLAFGLTAASARAQSPATKAVVAAERAFAAQALAEGTKPAFLAFMTDSAVVFSRAEPALARGVWGGRPAPTPTDPTLHWGPACAGAAASGELGYSTGPWFLTQPDGQRVAYGQFFTIWARQPDGRYRWLLDNGISHPAPVGSPEPPATLLYPAAGQAPKRGSAAVLTRPAQLDEQLTAAVAAQGLAAAYAARLHPQARLLRENVLPLLTPAAIQQQLGTEAPRQLQPAGGRVARSGELAYTYGTFQTSGGAAARGSYVHLWQHGPGGWQLLAEVLNEAPQNK